MDAVLVDRRLDRFSDKFENEWQVALTRHLVNDYELIKISFTTFVSLILELHLWVESVWVDDFLHKLN